LRLEEFIVKEQKKYMRIPKKYLKIGGIVLAIFLIIILVVGVIAYNKREAILKTVIAKAINKAKKDYNLNVEIKSARFKGFKTVALKDISVVPENRDSLAHISDLSVSVQLLPLIVGDVKLSEVQLSNGKIDLIKRDSIRNYDFLFKKKKDSTKVKSRIDLAELANKLLNNTLDKIPEDMNVKNFLIRIKHDEDSLKFFAPSATIVDGDMQSSILVNEKESTWHVSGQVHPSDKQLSFKLFADGKKVELPLIEKKLKLKLNFDTISTELKRVSKDGDELRIYGSWAVKNLLINHEKIAANDIIVPDGSIDANMFIGPNYVSIDSSSVIHLKNIKANPYIKYTLSPKKIYELKLHTEEVDAQELFNSFPLGLFESLEGIKVAGNVQYDLNFYLDETKPDQVRFDSGLKSDDFRIIDWGKTNLGKINNSFVYTPYEYGKPMRDIVVGPGNPDYTPLNEISPNLKNALLTAEDPSFFDHKGFVEESIRKSIATNFKEKAFKRGGSTISMQLVKNVFLNRQKTLARKIEEILIVWLMENTKVSSKQRMFEVYLNLIEWGRNVYGIGEAARYYFDKHPSQLSLGEGIFLASIVPRPKQSLYFFQGDGSLRTGLRGYFRLIGNLMAKRGYTSRDTNAYGFYGVRLKESLRRQIAPDTVAVDSALILDEEEFGEHETFLDRIFGRGKRRDTVTIEELDNNDKKQPADSIKSPEQSRKERREERRRRRREEGGLLKIF
jgi:hypothetical protein